MFQVDKKILRDSLNNLTEKYTSRSETNLRLIAIYTKLSTRLIDI
ncbi:hypothetical protein Slin14017_G128480 [Septoria linicola]|nr:hypothetical protein Slin14017_G128480 [Septoria linicola]